MNRVRFCMALFFFVLPASGFAQNSNCVGESNEPLIQAISDGNLQKARSIVKTGAKLNIHDKCGLIPLHEAIRWSYTDFPLELLAAGADPKFPDGGIEALVGAAFLCNPKVVAALLKRGVPVNAAKADGTTALMEAPSQKCKDGATVQLLLDAGANPNARNHDGLSPLLAAAMAGDPIGAAKLLKAGADPTAKDNEGHTAEDEACDRGEQGHSEVCLLVREAGRKK